MKKTDGALHICKEALHLIERLEEAGFEAYVVGGCLRDALLGREANDVDLTTSALPQELARVFSGFHLCETGLAHGTLTVFVGDMPLEVTTYRIDGAYEDHRRPKQVRFSRQVEEDLARRDFTINAMAWNPRQGLVDPFGGKDDLRCGILRCVGDPRLRFTEDALRILRALRFQAVYGFTIEAETAAAMEEKRGLLACISKERSWVELKKLLAGPWAAESLQVYGHIWQSAFSEFPALFEQAVESVRAAEKVGDAEESESDAIVFKDRSDDGEEKRRELALLRLALLFGGDCEKTQRFCRQAKVSREEQRILAELAEGFTEALAHSGGQLKRWVFRSGYAGTMRLLMLHRAKAAGALRLLERAADRQTTAQAQTAQEPAPEDILQHRQRYQRCRELQKQLCRYKEEQSCVSLAQLAIDGRTLLACGIPAGAQIKALLTKALFAVMDDLVENREDALLAHLQLQRQEAVLTASSDQ